LASKSTAYILGKAELTLFLNIRHYMNSFDSETQTALCSCTSVTTSKIPEVPVLNQSIIADSLLVLRFNTIFTWR
jgi:hypothetical protein